MRELLLLAMFFLSLIGFGQNSLISSKDSTYIKLIIEELNGIFILKEM